MIRRPLGSTGIEITPLGFGAWSVGGSDWEFSGPPERDADSIACMLHAFELGVNWLDTAPVYGRGHSEELVGEIVRRLGGQTPLIFTKCGREWAAPDARPVSDLRPASIRSGCEASLRRLGVDAIDVLQHHVLHFPIGPGQ